MRVAGYLLRVIADDVRSFHPGRARCVGRCARIARGEASFETVVAQALGVLGLGLASWRRVRVRVRVRVRLVVLSPWLA